MESVINNQYIESYARTFSNIVLKSFFSENEYISGEEILQVTAIKQINLSIIKNLMDTWQSESDKLKSPYFNYENQEVKSAMQELLGVLSRNIRIDEKHFKPLLEEAVRDTLFLLFSPYDYFHKDLKKSNRNIRVETLEKQKKFIRINAGLYDALLDKLHATGKDELKPEETIAYFNQVCEESSFEPDETDPCVDKLSETEPFYIQKIYKEMEHAVRPVPNEETRSEATDETGSTVYEQYLEPRETLADELKNESSTVLDIHQKQKIDSIRKNISIQQKFLFVKELFQNNDPEFNQVVDFLDQCSSRDEAFEYLENNYFKPGAWQDDNETVAEFMAVLDKKFV